MQHPDEGIIHAWIDSALSPAEAAELEAHVATCSACAAIVAEARGLVAASSRIIGHLDAVPGNVIPATPAKAKFSLVRSRWPIAIAATLVLGISLYSRSSERPSVLSEMTPMQEIAKMELGDSVVLAPVTRPAASQTPATPPTIGPSARQRAETREPVAQRMAAVVGAADATNQSATDAAVSSTAASAPLVPSLPRAAGGVASGSGSGSGSENVRLRGDLAANAASRATAAAPTRAPTPTPTPTVTADVTTRLVGCYQMNASTETFPARFALVADPVPGASGLLAVRYVDANGRLSDRILDAGWTPEEGRAVVKTVARNPILTLSRSGETVVAQSPNGPRTGRVGSCREF